MFEILAEYMITMLTNIHDLLDSINENLGIENIMIACLSINDSINRLVKLYYGRPNSVLSKIEFELLPLIEEMKLNFYFWGYAYPDKDLIEDYYKNKMIPLSANKYIDEAEKTGRYKYDLSIIVTGYNKIDYTKMCVDSLLKYIPKNLNYELILRNHGSTDETKAFFESINPTKQIDIYKNGGGLNAAFRIIQGKYTIHISNDIIITENAIANMIKCIESDENIAWVVPTTPNVSNLQSIEARYTNIHDMQEFAKNNNISNSNRWEQRVRLCNPIEIVRSRVCFSSQGIGYGRYYYSNNIFSFPDDVISLCMRRKGYKMILAKDAYCYHFGSITLKDEVEQQNYYSEGRKEFYNFFGIDPWGTGFCWDPDLFKCLPCNEKGHIDILGINCGIGSNPLKVKESIKENVHNLDVKIYNITDEKCYIEDLKGVSDSAEYIESLENIEDIINGKKFNYIIFESKFDTYNNPLSTFKKIFINLEKGGFLSIKTSNVKVKKEIKKNCSNYREVGEWLIIDNI